MGFQEVVVLFRRQFRQLSIYFLLILLLDLPLLHVQRTLAQKSHSPPSHNEDDEVFAADPIEEQQHNVEPKVKQSDTRQSSEFDEDEFVGAEQGSSKTQTQKEKISFGPVDKQNYYPEVAALIFIVLYVLNFFIGRRANDQIAQSWIQTYRGLFELQFASVGFSEAPTAAVQGTSDGLLKESQNTYKYYATGRRHCHCVLATLELRKRHDLFSLFLAAVDLSTSADTLTIEVPMNDADMEPFVFAIVRRKQERKIRKATKDLENYSNPVKSTRLPASLCLLTDCPELDRDFVDDAVVNVLKEKEDLFVSLHFTDQNNSIPFYLGGGSNGNKKFLKFKFNLPKSTTEMEDLRPLIKMTLHFIDRVATKRLSTQARQKAVQQRKIVAEKLFKASHAQRQEALTKRKEDLRKKEEDTTGMTPEQLRKKEERDYKAALKRKQPKVKIMR